MIEIYIILSLVIGIGIGYFLASQNSSTNDEDIDSIKKEMENTFKALALDVNRSNTEEFFKLANDKFQGLSKESDKNLETKTNFDVNHPGALKAPMVGTAYVSPEPGKAPFIRIGDTVSKNQPLLIVEAMKVMNTITAPKGGKVVFIGFEDGQPVEFEQLLVIIE